MSAESYAANQFQVALRDPRFIARLDDISPLGVVVVDDSKPVGEALSNVPAGGVLAIHREDAPDGFELYRIARVDR